MCRPVQPQGFPVLNKEVLADRITEFVVEAPLIARAAMPGNFVLVRGDRLGERIPLTIADSDPERGTITLVIQEVGRTTFKFCAYNEGEAFLDVAGPLGKDRVIDTGGRTVCCVSGGLGVAPMYPQTKAYHEAGNRVISILGARSESLLFWRERIEAISDETLYSTDDGSFGHHGYATELIDQLVKRGERIDEVVAIGPVPHMKAVTQCCKKHGLPVVVSLNPIMVDGTGMCGGCRVSVDGAVKYACVDGPEFDGALVDFDELMTRQGAYKIQEAAARARPLTSPGADEVLAEESHPCRAMDATPIPSGPAVEGRAPTLHDFEVDVLAWTLRSIEKVLRNRKSFEEVALGFNIAEAQSEAGRCKFCNNPTCLAGCPVDIDIPGFIQAIQRNQFPEAARIMKDRNSLPAICGRVCPQETQCEIKCVLLKTDKRPVSIGRLERFIADWEAAQGMVIPPTASPTGQKAAMVGCGPGSLTCAGDLAKLGYDVTIFEALHDTGGVLRYGIPEFRLPKTIVDREVEYVKKLGVTIELNTVVGKTRTIGGLRAEGFQAIFIAVGAGAPMFLGIPGENLLGVYSANEFLTRVNLMKAYRSDTYDTPVIVGENVAVIGAGNVSMDAARVAVRLGAKQVSIIYRRSDAEMPARAEEIVHARLEGVVFRLLTNPVRIVGDETDHVRAIECIRMELGEPDDSGRRRPVPVESSEFTIDCDMVIPALGNVANPLLTSTIDGLELNRWGNIVVDPETGLTNIPGVYAGGDIVTGSATVIEAMGAGRIAARAIVAYLTSKRETSRTDAAVSL